MVARSCSYHCPHCEAIQLFLTLRPPFTDITVCSKCGKRFELTTKALADFWIHVIVLWGAVVGTVFFALGFLMEFEILAALFFAPALGLGVGLLAILIAIPIGWYAARQLKTHRSGTKKLKKVRVREHGNWLEGLLAFFQPNSMSAETEAELAEIEAQLPARSYLHARCGGVTRVSGDEFERLSNPFTLVSQTYCAGCDDHVSLSDVVWEEQHGESIAAERARLRRTASSKTKIVGYIGTPGLGFLIGWGLSRGLLFDDPPWNVLFGILGAVSAGAFVTPYACKWFGADYSRRA